MATATSNIKRVVTGEVVLTLTLEETVVLRSILAACCSNALHAPKAVNQIYHALAGVPADSAIASASIEFNKDANARVNRMLEDWKTET